MGIKQRFDRDKAVETILFIAEKIKHKDFYNVLKLVYLADQLHLQEHGRLIFGDNYAAMGKGPVPSEAYNLIKKTKGYYGRNVSEVYDGFCLDGFQVITERKFDSYLLSKSDVDCLSETMQKFGHLTGPELMGISHDKAYHAAFDNRGSRKSAPMPLLSIAEMQKDSEDLIEHLGLAG